MITCIGIFANCRERERDINSARLKVLKRTALILQCLLHVFAAQASWACFAPREDYLTYHHAVAGSHSAGLGRLASIEEAEKDYILNFQISRHLWGRGDEKLRLNKFDYFVTEQSKTEETEKGLGETIYSATNGHRDATFWSGIGRASGEVSSDCRIEFNLATGQNYLILNDKTRIGRFSLEPVQEGDEILNRISTLRRKVRWIPSADMIGWFDHGEILDCHVTTAVPDGEKISVNKSSASLRAKVCYEGEESIFVVYSKLGVGEVLYVYSIFPIKFGLIWFSSSTSWVPIRFPIPRTVKSVQDLYRAKEKVN